MIIDHHCSPVHRFKDLGSLQESTVALHRQQLLPENVFFFNFFIIFIHIHIDHCSTVPGSPLTALADKMMMAMKMIIMDKLTILMMMIIITCSWLSSH